jgi:hypothetical protein
MTVIFLREALQEFEDAATYLEKEQPGLGFRLRNEVDIHIRWILQHQKFLG